MTQKDNKYFTYSGKATEGLTVGAIKKKRSFYILYYSILSIILTLIIVCTLGKSIYRLFNEVLILQEVHIHGNKRVYKEEILQMLSNHLGKTIFTLSIEKLHNILKARSEVHSVNLSLLLPGYLNIFIKEKVPVAIWQNNKNNFLIDECGNVISSDIKEFDEKQYVTLTGQDANNHIGLILQVLEALEDCLHMEKINVLEFIDRRRWNIILKNGLTIKLPEKQSIHTVEIIKKFINSEKIKVLDLRLYPKRIYIV